MMSRPLGSIAMQIHEPSPISDERINSALKPGNTVNESAGVATGSFKTSPQGAAPSLPLLLALLQPLALKSKSCHPVSSLSDASHDSSVTMKASLFLPENNCNVANTPATSLLTLRPRIAMTLRPC